MNDIELLQYVHETAEMGIEGLNSLDVLEQLDIVHIGSPRS